MEEYFDLAITYFLRPGVLEMLQASGIKVFIRVLNSSWAKYWLELNPLGWGFGIRINKPVLFIYAIISAINTSHIHPAQVFLFAG